MNIFILLEGKTERKIYPKWLAQLVPQLTKVDRPDLVRQDNYCVICDFGYPFKLSTLKQSIEEVNDRGNFDFFLIVADTDEQSVRERETEINDFLRENNVALNPSTQFIIILQRCCIETWFLGNRHIHTENSSNVVLANYYEHYNITSNDPELMPLPENYGGSIGKFHKMYHKEMNDEFYRNRNVTEIEINHLNGIIERFEETRHLETFGNLLNFCRNLNNHNN